MKQSLLFLSALLVSTFVSANDRFDETINYQFNNATAYIGETLYLVPLSGSKWKVGLFSKPQEHYHNFEDFEGFYTEDLSLMYTQNNYKYNPSNPIDCMIAGTHKRHIEGHRFYVDTVIRVPENRYHWVLYLTDLETKDKVKYVYSGENKSTKIDIEVFPFIVEKHYNYLMSLKGTKLTFATQGYEMFIEESYRPYYQPTYEYDLNSGDKIYYIAPFETWTIDEVGFDIYESSMYFIVANEAYKTKIIYDNIYTEKQPAHNIGNRVFTEKQWKSLVKKYGIEHMALIMSSKMSDDMTEEELYMAGGRKYVKMQANHQKQKAEENSTPSVKYLLKELLKALF